MMYRDPIPRINFTGAWKAKGTIRTLPSHKNARLHDHDFNSPIYKGALNHHLDKYYKSGGVW